MIAGLYSFRHDPFPLKSRGAGWTISITIAHSDPALYSLIRALLAFRVLASRMCDTHVRRGRPPENIECEPCDVEDGKTRRDSFDENEEGDILKHTDDTRGERRSDSYRIEKQFNHDFTTSCEDAFLPIPT
jgi:hypothetical protein